jgi:hypothetical protein
LVSGYEGMVKAKEGMPAPRRSQLLDQAGQRIVFLYETWGKPGQASEWQSRLKENGAR